MNLHFKSSVERWHNVSRRRRTTEQVLYDVYNNRRLRMTLSAHNLLNEVYFWNGDTSNGESADPGPPRLVLIDDSVFFRLTLGT